MAELQASRTLVKSGPELWAECSDAGSLAKHLGEFGEITITKLEPENTVAWEGDAVSGTVRLEPAGWGTRVTLTAFVESPEGDDPSEAQETALAPVAVDPPAPELPAPEPLAPEPLTPEPLAPEPTVRPSFLRRLFGTRRRSSPPEEAVPAEPSAAADSAPPVAPPQPAPEAPETAASAAETPGAAAPAPQAAVLLSALDSLGTAHRRPFSRS
jgi:hypothetical protein